MAVAILDTGTGSGLLGARVGAGNYTFTRAISAGSSRALLVGVFKYGSSTIGAGSYGGQAMTAIAAESTIGSSACRLFYLLETGIAAAGTTTVTIPVNGDTDDFLIAAMIFSGVASVSGPTSIANTTVSPMSLSIASLTANDYAVGFGISSDTALTATGGTETGGYRQSSFRATSLLSRAGSSGVVSWTFNAGGDNSAAHAIGLIASGGGGSFNPAWAMNSNVWQGTGARRA